MSHFTVLVIGPDPEAQLQPFHEFECTGIDDQYVHDVDITEEVRTEYDTNSETMTLAEYVTYSRGERPIVGPGEDPDLDGDAKYGYMRVDTDGEVVQIVKRTNRAARWDWWVLGGRWCGFFPVRPDADRSQCKAGRGAGAAHGLMPEEDTADQLRVCDVDFAKARGDAEKEAVELFNKWERLVHAYGRAESWTMVRERMDDIDAARQVYREQPLIRAAERDEERGGLGFRFGCWVEFLGYDRAAYITSRRNAALVPYAVVYKGKWTAKGEMGWWGFSNDTVSEEEWCEHVARLYDDLPPDTLLTLVDCHI